MFYNIISLKRLLIALFIRQVLKLLNDYASQIATLKQLHNSMDQPKLARQRRARAFLVINKTYISLLILQHNIVDYFASLLGDSFFFLRNASLLGDLRKFTAEERPRTHAVPIYTTWTWNSHNAYR